jgi:TPR repeat protein
MTTILVLSLLMLCPVQAQQTAPKVPQSALQSRQTLPQLSVAAAQGDKAALAQLRTRAEQGNAEAQWRLGILYDQSVGSVLIDGILKDSARAIQWYRKAAEQGYARMVK